MARARIEFEWRQTASAMALLANCHRGKGRPFTPDDFFKFEKSTERARDGVQVTARNINVLRALVHGSERRKGR